MLPNRNLVKCIFTILLQIQSENNFLPTSKHQQSNSIITHISCSENVWKQNAILAQSSHKTVKL